MTERENAIFLADEAKKYDYDRWLMSLFSPAPSRADIHALLTFNAEIAKVRETVSEVLLGDIRFQWWRDALDNIEDVKYENHPVLQSLKSVIFTHDLNVEDFELIIDARSKDLDPCPFKTTEDLLDYAEGTGGILNELFYRVMGFNDEDGLIAARQVGKVFAFTGIIRAIPYHASQDLILIPSEVMSSHGLMPETIFLEENRSSFLKVVKSITELGIREQRNAVAMKDQRPKIEKRAYSLLALNKLYLSRLQQAGFDPARQNLKIGSVRKIIALLMA